jgi:hypothetical protein
LANEQFREAIRPHAAIPAAPRGEIVALKQPFQACGKLRAILYVWLKRKEHGFTVAEKMIRYAPEIKRQLVALVKSGSHALVACK